SNARLAKKTAAITSSRPVATTFMPCAPGCDGLKRDRAPFAIPLMPGSIAEPRPEFTAAVSFGGNGVADHVCVTADHTVEEPADAAFHRDRNREVGGHQQEGEDGR